MMRRRTFVATFLRVRNTVPGDTWRAVTYYAVLPLEFCLFVPLLLCATRFALFWLRRHNCCYIYFAGMRLGDVWACVCC